MTLLLTGIFLAILSTVIVQAIQKEQVGVAGLIAAITTFLNVQAIVQVVGGAQGILYAIGVGIGTAGTVYWAKKRG